MLHKVLFSNPILSFKAKKMHRKKNFQSIYYKQTERNNSALFIFYAKQHCLNHCFSIVPKTLSRQKHTMWHVPFFWCITRYFLLLGRPIAGYKARYTLLKSETARRYLFLIMVKFLLPYITSKCVVFSVFTDRMRHSATRGLAVTGGGWPLHT